MHNLSSTEEVFSDQPQQEPKKPAGRFQSACQKRAEAANKGSISRSRTGNKRQATVEFAKPPKNIYVRVSQSPEHRFFSIATYHDEVNDQTWHVPADLYESGTLPERFLNSCKLRDIYLAAAADRTFFLWFINVSASKWRKAAVKAVQAAMQEWVIITSVKARSTYNIEPATFFIPEPDWTKLPAPFEQLVSDAFEGTILVPDHEVVNRVMSGGYSDEDDADTE